ncbi:UNVERIFIED_CONTAM: hypothetical protein HDU68_005342 [Siphonaria sp. JEL0065]|nr:hypothetical protein HDU68_005342 [Siphonaria sp. JEL0065]
MQGGIPGQQSILHQQLQAQQQNGTGQQQNYQQNGYQQGQQQPQHHQQTIHGNTHAYTDEYGSVVGSLGSNNYYGSYASSLPNGQHMQNNPNTQLNSPIHTSGNTPNRGPVGYPLSMPMPGPNMQQYDQVQQQQQQLSHSPYDASTLGKRGNQMGGMIGINGVANYNMLSGSPNTKTTTSRVRKETVNVGSPNAPPAMNLYQNQRHGSIAAESFIDEDIMESAGGGKIMDSNEKRARRRASHNAVERRRRDIINEKIHELSQLLPDHHLLPADAQNKGSILRRSVDHMRGVQALAGRQAERITELEGVCRALMQRANVMEHELVMSLPLGTTFELPVAGMPGGGITGSQLAGARMAAEAAGQNSVGAAAGLVGMSSDQRRDSIAQQGTGLGMMGVGGMNNGGFGDNTLNPHQGQMNFGLEGIMRE